MHPIKKVGLLQSSAFRYYRFSQFVIYFFGLWPVSTTKKKSFREKLVICVFISNLYPLVLKLYTSHYSLELLIFALQNSLIDLIGLQLCYTFISKRKYMIRLIECFEDNYNELMDIKEMEILITYIRRSSTYINICTCGALAFNTCSLLFLLFPLLTNSNNSYKITLKVEYLVDHQKYLYPILLHVIVGFVVKNGVLIPGYVLILLSLHVNCALFNIARYNLRKAFDRSSLDVSLPLWKIKKYVRLIRSIKYYRKATKFITLLNTVTEMTSIILVSIGMIVACACLVMMKNFTENKIDVVSYVTLFLEIVCSQFIFAHIGQKVLKHSLSIFDEACIVPYYFTPLKMQKTLLMLLITCARPSKFKYGKIFSFCHESFAEIMRMILSYAMVINSIKTNINLAT